MTEHPTVSQQSENLSPPSWNGATSHNPVLKKNKEDIIYSARKRSFLLRYLHSGGHHKEHKPKTVLIVGLILTLFIAGLTFITLYLYN